MTVGGDPDELLRMAAAGPGQAFELDRRARVLELLTDRRASRGAAVDTAPVVAGLRRLGRRIVDLDAWVARVAALLRAADTGGLRGHLLALGPDHAAAAATLDADALPLGRLTAEELDVIASRPSLPVAWRDVVHRERLRRWVRRLDERVAAVAVDPEGPLDRIVAWIDRHLVDLTSPVVDLHVSPEEQVERLRAEAAGARLLLARPDLTVLAFTPRSATPRGGPAVRVALGDVGSASTLAVLVPGTATGLAAPETALRDARALHDRGSELATATSLATVLDLYDTPPDLGAAADPRTGRAAGRSLAAFLGDLPAPAGGRRTTLVGHSYGAFAAAAAVTPPDPAEVDALVLLGAPGVGVTHRDALAAREVWAVRAPGDPIGLVADLDELVRGLPPRLRPRSGPLLDPLVALGPDPVDDDFGARRLRTGPDTPRGHVHYLRPGSSVLDHVARIAHAPDG